MKKLKLYIITGIIFVSVLGTLFHFVYDWSGNNFFIGLFTPVNESIWEHTKLIFFPMLIYSLYLNCNLKSEYPCIRSSMLFSTLLGVILIIVLFYTYSGIAGFNIPPVDIAIFYISVIISFFISYKLTLSCKLDKVNGFLLILNVLFFCLFVFFTLYPPDIPLFSAP